jgi:hypothetical protein
VGRTKATGHNGDVGVVKAVFHLTDYRFCIVINGYRPGALKALLRKILANPRSVGIHHIANEEFPADRNNVHLHKKQ